MVVVVAVLAAVNEALAGVESQVGVGALDAAVAVAGAFQQRVGEEGLVGHDEQATDAV
jgi:hypothetical protein